jgi:rhamnose utilization protein RhaD (predicted bifunctional aldolase and dehydrogenase)
MENRWSDTDARACIERCAETGAGEDLALRVYTSRLIGIEPDLVLHGGGNTSLKSRAPDLFGSEIEVLHIKGSGWDLASIEPAGLPAVALAPLCRLRDLEHLDDAIMLAELRRALLDSAAPTPSVETLLHAFLPHRYIDHSHADAILALTNQSGGEARVRALLGERVAWVPYVMPGLALAKRAAEIWEKHPDVEGLVLEKHGFFSFGETARESYERHIALVDVVERHLAQAMEGRRPLDARPVVAAREPGEVAPLVRGALAEATGNRDAAFRRFILTHRSSDDILHFAASDLGPRLAVTPPITPDHVIRTKGAYLFIERPPYNDLAALGNLLRGEVERYRHAYRQYFERNAAGRPGLVMLDPTPRVVVLPGIGLFAAGDTAKAARIAADIAEHTIRTKIRASTNGAYDGLGERDLIDMEYWSLEQAKLGKQAPAPLAGQVALVTGGAGAIGEGIARRLVGAGAHVVLLDIDAERLARVAASLGSSAVVTVEADVTDENEVEQAFARAAAAFGGIDLAVVNAGIAATGTLEELDSDDFDRTVDVNLRGSFLTLRQALRSLRQQGTGGNIVLLSTKNVFAPGAGFGAYSASKAGAHQLKACIP